MVSKLIAKWKSSGLGPSNFEFFTNRSNLVIGKLPNQDAEVEYTCPHCNFYEVKTIQMKKNMTKSGKTSKKFIRPEFPCSKCNKTIEVPTLKQK